MAGITTRAGRTIALAVLAACAAMAFATASAQAAPFNVGSGTLTWNVAHEPAPGTGTLSNYATTIGHGSVAASGGATGTTITSATAAAAGLKVPFAFPAAASGAGTYDPVAKTGVVNFTGTLTFTAHDQTFFSVVNPTLSFDAPQSIRVVANGKVPSGTIGSTDPPVDYGTSAARQTVFALDGTAAVTTANPDGSYTISNLIPSATSSTPASFLSSNAAFNGIRTWFTTDRPNQAFSVTLAPAGVTPDPDPDPPTGSAKDLVVNGDVADVLSLTLNSASVSLGSFLPAVAANYDASVAATATATRSSVLTVLDSGATPGFLLNGTKALASALKVCATTSASPTCSYSNLGSSAQQLLALPAGQSATPVTVGLRQSISAGEGLVAGTYGKTLTFTLSAGTP